MEISSQKITMDCPRCGNELSSASMVFGLDPTVFDVNSLSETYFECDCCGVTVYIGIDYSIEEEYDDIDDDDEE